MRVWSVRMRVWECQNEIVGVSGGEYWGVRMRVWGVRMRLWGCQDESLGVSG